MIKLQKQLMDKAASLTVLEGKFLQIQEVRVQLSEAMQIPKNIIHFLHGNITGRGTTVLQI